MSFCTACGSALNEGAKFCSVCGTAVPETPIAPAPTPAPAPIPVEEPVCVQKPVYEAPKEPKKGMNFAALSIVAIISLLWLFAPVHGQRTCYDIFSSMFKFSSMFQNYVSNVPLALFPLTTAFCWIFCAAFTLGMKMPPVRVFASISTGISSFLLMIQIIVASRSMSSIGFGFWGIYLGTIVLICLGGTRYKKN